MRRGARGGKAERRVAYKTTPPSMLPLPFSFLTNNDSHNLHPFPHQPPPNQTIFNMPGCGTAGCTCADCGCAQGACNCGKCELPSASTSSAHSNASRNSRRQSHSNHVVRHLDDMTSSSNLGPTVFNIRIYTLTRPALLLACNLPAGRSSDSTTIETDGWGLAMVASASQI